MKTELSPALRAYDQATDLSFLFKAWLSSYRKSERAGVIPDHLFYPVHKAAINQLIARGMRITMAVSPDDRDQILGFIAYEPGPILHYIFVKDFVREQGVASLLLASANFAPDGPIFHTYWTSDLKRRFKNTVHKPGFARRKLPYDPAADGPLHD